MAAEGSSFGSRCQRVQGRFDSLRLMHADARLSSKSVLRNMLHSREVFHEQAHKQASLRLSSGSGCRAMMRSRSDKDVAHARKACRDRKSTRLNSSHVKISY